MKVKLNLAWFLFYGRNALNMSRQEILVTKYGEMRDMITCLQIQRGELVPAGNTRKKYTYEEAIALR